MGPNNNHCMIKYYSLTSMIKSNRKCIYFSRSLNTNIHNFLKNKSNMRYIIITSMPCMALCLRLQAKTNLNTFPPYASCKYAIRCTSHSSNERMMTFCLSSMSCSRSNCKNIAANQIGRIFIVAKKASIHSSIIRDIHTL